MHVFRIAVSLFVLFFPLFCFDRSFAVLFRNAQLPLMRSKPSTPKLYKFHSILLGRFRFVNKREAGPGAGAGQNEWHAKLYAIFIWKILNWFYAFSVCTHVYGGISLTAASLTRNFTVAAAHAKLQYDMCPPPLPDVLHFVAAAVANHLLQFSQT